MKCKLLLCSLMLLTNALPALSAEMTSGDKEFMALAARAGKLEVELGNMAESKAEKTSVKNFGKDMIKDHTKASNELKGKELRPWSQLLFGLVLFVG